MVRRLLSRWTWLLPPLLVSGLILYPAITLVLGSLSDAPPGEPGAWTVGNFVAILSSPRFFRLVLTSIGVSFAATFMAIMSAFAMAWLTERTDIPLRQVIAAFAASPFLIPASLSAIGWASLANPDVGLLNVLVGAKIFNIYSYGGLAFVLAQHSAGFLFLMLVGPLRNVDTSLEEAARVGGASTWCCFRRIQLPLVWPIVASLALLTFVRAFEAFEVPVIIGTPGNLYVVTNDIYYYLKTSTPPQYGLALAQSVIVTMALGLVMVVQTRRASRARISVVGGKSQRVYRTKLGAWTRPCLAFAFLYAMCTSVLPLGTIVASSFFKYYGLYDLSTLTLDNYYDVLSDPIVRRAIGNTLIVMAVGATLCLLMGGLAAYSLERRFKGSREVLAGILMIPWSMPGIVFGLALLWAMIKIPGLYGSLGGIVTACVILGLPVALMSVTSSLQQTNVELEEAARVHGASTLQTMRLVLLPLFAPALISGWFILAAIFSRELAATVLLYGPGSEVLSVMILGYWEQGQGNYVAVLSIAMLCVLLVLQIARFIAERKTGVTGRALGTTGVAASASEPIPGR